MSRREGDEKPQSPGEKKEENVLVLKTPMNKEEGSIAPQNLGENQPEIIGPVWKLAKIKSEGGGPTADASLQSVLSWHLKDSLGAYVEEFPSKVECREDAEGGFWILDIVEPRPECEENLCKFPQAGNPIYAISLMEFLPEEHVNVSKVFDHVLGNTILIDDMDSAINFMKSFNEQSPFYCPTIITRDGCRLTSEAIFGYSHQVPEDWPAGALKLDMAQDQIE